MAMVHAVRVREDELTPDGDADGNARETGTTWLAVVVFRDDRRETLKRCRA